LWRQFAEGASLQDMSQGPSARAAGLTARPSRRARLFSKIRLSLHWLCPEHVQYLCGILLVFS
jgi:hypothetical protein